jgi:CubicO group peptidase (beta-lactamase class C family)
MVMRTALRFVLASSLAIASACADDESEGSVEASGATGTGGTGTTSSTGAGGVDGTGGAVPADCSGTEATDDLSAAAMDLLRSELTERGVPGGAFVIVQGGEVVAMGVSGSKSSTECDPITPDTLFRTAFMSEVVTTIAALDAVEDGLLQLDEPITDHIDLPVTVGDPSAIQLHHLLSNASMYASKSDTSSDAVCNELAYHFTDAVDPILETEPGTMQDPNDISNFEIAGLALQEVEGMPFEDVVRRRVLDPLDMGGGYDRLSIEAMDHTRGDGGQTPIHADCRHRDPSDNYHASIRDMAKLTTYLMRGGDAAILEPDMLERMRSTQGPHALSSSTAAYGLNVYHPPQDEDERIVWINSYSWGFTMDFWAFVERDVAVFTILNEYAADSSPLVEGLAALADPTTFPGWRADPFDAGAESLASLVGTYRDAIGAGDGERVLEVTLDPGSGELVGLLDGELEIDIEPVLAADNFLIDGSIARFWRDDTGAPYGVSLLGRFGPPFLRDPVQ